jgi:hypothetical protein
MKDPADLIVAAEFRPEPSVGPAFREDLIEKDVLLDTGIGAHTDQPLTVFISGRDDEGF